MKVALVSSILVLLIGLGYSFKLSDFFDDQTQRQSSVEDQILPVFTVAFFASLLNNLIFGITNQNSGKQLFGQPPLTRPTVVQCQAPFSTRV